MIQRVLTAAADERNQSNPNQAAIVPPRLEPVLTAKSIDLEIVRPYFALITSELNSDARCGLPI
jgi:hypothetical protein